MKKGYNCLITMIVASIMLLGCNSAQNSQDTVIDSVENEENESFTESNFIPETILKIPYATSNDGFVNIRSIPSNDGEILGKVSMFGNGVILGTEIDYYKVNNGEVTGYCYSKYIDYHTWYDGAGSKRLVATKDCPLYSGYSEGNAAPLATIPVGTIIGDKFYKDNPDDYQSIIEKGDCYVLNTPFDNEWKVKKSYVTVEKCNPSVVKNSNNGHQNTATSNNQEQRKASEEQKTQYGSSNTGRGNNNVAPYGYNEYGEPYASKEHARLDKCYNEWSNAYRNFRTTTDPWDKIYYQQQMKLKIEDCCSLAKKLGDKPLIDKMEELRKITNALSDVDTW